LCKLSCERGDWERFVLKKRLLKIKTGRGKKIRRNTFANLAKDEEALSTNFMEEQQGGHYQVALGALLGAACGDAAGAPLEHLGRVPQEHEVEVSLPSRVS